MCLCSCLYTVLSENIYYILSFPQYWEPKETPRHIIIFSDILACMLTPYLTYVCLGAGMPKGVCLIHIY